MDEYSHPGINSYERACGANAGATESKDVAPQYTLQGVLHFLQTEWACLEMQRSDWETDRAELRARIAFLEGERRGQENLKQDLVRRIKMLEYALKQERVKFHQFKASVAASASSGSSKTEPKSGSEESTDTRLQTVKADADVRNKPLEPGEKLAKCTEQALESNAKWRESRLRLKRFLQELGCTDAVVNARQARVLQLLMSAPGWRGALDQSDAALDANIKQQLKLSGVWPGGRSDAQDASGASVPDEQVQSALADMEEAVRQSPSSVSGRAAASNESGDESAEPDTTGQSLGGADTFDSADTTWVNRFRRSGGAHTAGDQDKQKESGQPCMGIGDEMNVKDAVSSFISGLKEGGSPGDMKRFGHKSNADKSVFELIQTFYDKPDADITDASRVAPSTSLPGSGQQSATGLASSAAAWPSERSDASFQQAGERFSAADSAHEDRLKETNPSEGLVLGDLANLTVANEMENAADVDACDSNSPLRPTDVGAAVGVSEGDTDAARATETTVAGHRPWAPRYTLRGHFDGIRSVAFHSTEPALFTAGEDGCVMLWNLSKGGPSGTGSGKGGSRASGTCPMDELEPVHNYCGHDGAVLSLATPPENMTPELADAVYSGGLDGTIRGWKIPAACSTSGVIDLYAPQDPDAVTDRVRRGSPAAVWALAMHPSNPLLLAAHADNAIEFWSTAEPIDASTSFAVPTRTVHLDRLFKPDPSDTDPLGRATCVHYLVNRPDSTVASQCLVGTSTGWLFLLDVETGQIVSQCAPAPKATEGSVSANVPSTFPTDWSSRALYALASHQTLSLVIGAHEDSCIRFYDIGRMSAECCMVGNAPFVDGMVAHMDAITSLAVDPNGLYLFTGGHDASVRVWDLETRACVQEMTNHRVKNAEAVHAVALHPQLPLAASAGADAICKVYVTAT
ncbi:unnamed protein product [Calicophoron daubneyi]|uniref:Striatin N-terminal domain-containing protein n=1 Tax=Calicophoron daubneyi TaxID=300641 RepID=A0AAV2T3P4_CALDB